MRTWRAALINYAQPIVNELRANMVRVDADLSATPIKAKIPNFGESSVHTRWAPEREKAKAEASGDILAAMKSRRA